MKLPSGQSLHSRDRKPGYYPFAAVCVEKVMGTEGMYAIMTTECIHLGMRIIIMSRVTCGSP